MLNLPSLEPALWFATAAGLCAGISVTGLLALWRRQSSSTAATLAAIARELVALRADAQSQSATLLGLAGRFDTLGRELASDALHATHSPGNVSQSAYELAIRLARGGATVEELARDCMLTRHEAQLALRIHGPGGRAGRLPEAANG